MIVFSNCKINLGLHITKKREDGYHDLETVFFPLPLFDVLELNQASETALTILGQHIPGNATDNIILKAYYILQNDSPNLPPVHFHLLKNIPVGAGLGAGSANGAYTLMALNTKFNLNLSADQLNTYALRLGSDCPFFIYNRPCVATGRGELFTIFDINLSGYNILIVNPGIHIPTHWAFAQIQPRKPEKNLRELTHEPVENWAGLVTNDFEKAVIKLHPAIGAIKNSLYKLGASFALMSGSGSTVYGLFKKEVTIKTNFPSAYFTKLIAL